MTFFRFVRWLSATCLVFLVLTSVAMAAWKENVLYSFQGGSDGYMPAGGVVLDGNGNLYGATTYGGPEGCTPIGYGCGTVFELMPPAQKGQSWTETPIYKFQGEAMNDASFPMGGVVIDGSGNVYGTSAYGGTGTCILLGIKAGCGTVFKLSPPTQKGGGWTETIVYSFQSGKDGYFPWGNLVFDKNGNLYGATQYGGGKGTACNSNYGGNCGTIFKLSPPKKKGGQWTETILHSFAGIAPGKQYGDGAAPNGGLVFDGAGEVYGTTALGGDEGGVCSEGGNGGGCGIVFALVPPPKTHVKWKEVLIHRFANSNDGAGPNGGLIIDGKGGLCGTAGGGGKKQSGLVFRITGPKWKETVLYNFTGGDDGSGPASGLVSDSSGNLYGTGIGGKTFLGVVFRVTRHGGSWSDTTLYNFKSAPDGNHAFAGVVLDGSGNLYGSTISGGTGNACQGGCGTVFQLGP